MQITEHLKLVPGNRVAVMIDNLGGTSVMEMNILSAETKAYLGKLWVFVSSESYSPILVVALSS